MTHRGPFQPLPFCDSVSPKPSRFSGKQKKTTTRLAKGLPIWPETHARKSLNSSAPNCEFFSAWWVVPPALNSSQMFPTTLNVAAVRNACAFVILSLFYYYISCYIIVIFFKASATAAQQALGEGSPAWEGRWTHRCTR